MYYRELLTRPFSFSWKYYSALALVISVFLTIVSSVPLVPQVGQVVHEFPPKFFAYYPDELEIRIEKGIVSSNVVEPYVLPMPVMLQREARLEGAQESLAVIDTKTLFSVEQFHAYKTLLWIGKDQLAIYDGNGGVRIEPLNKRMDLVVNEGVLRVFEQQLRPFYPFAALLSVIVIFLGLIVALGINFAYLILGAVFIFFLGRLLKERWSYGTAYRIGLHAITLPLLLDTLFSLFDLPLFYLPFLFTAIMLGVVFVNFKDAEPLVPERSTLL